MSEHGRPPIVDLRARLGSARRIVRRSRLPRLVFVVAVGWAVGSSVASAQDSARHARHRWGTETTVWVAHREVTAGSVIEPGDVEPRRLPQALVPEGVVKRDPTGVRARDRLLPGEPVHSARLAGDTGAVAARLPPDTVAISLTHDGAALEPDDRIDLHSLLTGTRLARDARVLTVDDLRFTAAVGRAEITGVVRALTTGGLVPVVTG